MDWRRYPRVITRAYDSTGAPDNRMVWRWDHTDPFGAVQPNQDPSDLGLFKYNPRFSGQVYDAETGLYYNVHRHYSPGTGTYTTSDPIELAGGINTYSYVNGNPVNYTDPLGLSPGTDGAPSRGIGGVLSEFWDWYDKKSPPIDPPPKSECPDKDCKAIKQQCVNQCFPIFDKGDGNGYLKCIAECLIENGCSSYNSKWKT